MADQLDRSGSSEIPWRPVRGSRVSEEVIDQIRDAFFEGLSPGDWLGTETELAERFGVSRITIRDAVRTLEARGIVDVKVGARGGLRIAEADPGRYVDALAVQLRLMGVTFTELIDAQCAIEPVTAELAARHATDDQLKAISDKIEDARAAIADPAVFTRRSLDFHTAIAEASGNRALHATLVALTTVQKPKISPRANQRRAKRVLRTHEDIYKAIAEGDDARARGLMEEHVGFLRREHPSDAVL